MIKSHDFLLDLKIQVDEIFLPGLADGYYLSKAVLSKKKLLAPLLTSAYSWIIEVKNIEDN